MTVERVMTYRELSAELGWPASKATIVEVWNHWDGFVEGLVDLGGKRYYANLHPDSNIHSDDDRNYTLHSEDEGESGEVLAVIGEMDLEYQPRRHRCE